MEILKSFMELIRELVALVSLLAMIAGIVIVVALLKGNFNQPGPTIIQGNFEKMQPTYRKGW